ncbi:hypothetical protein F0L46_18460 [Salinarimonas soli]|uniref:Uncharacterized protein n=2 Tax=Salinarimonas soli TaxID=1638099 RepID=A0A5B2V9Y1_9HYPH|nr:hypothetical protein F0L46_18460 [Salinarimonas soli]
MPWFAAPDYADTRAAMADRDKLPADHGTWLASAGQVEGELTRVGFEVVRVVIERETFLAWCREAGTVPDGRARSQFANAAAGIEGR